MIRTLLAAALLVLAAAPFAHAGDRPGDFDFYVLSLSWSPTYCRQEDRPDARQCGRNGPPGFVVHGLWPQRERGWPSHCHTDTPYVPRSLLNSVRDLFPNPGLAASEWRKHGACTGLGPADYFALVRKARGLVTIPDNLDGEDDPSSQGTEAIETAFAQANPGLKADMIGVSCRDGALSEVRICMDRDLHFRACREIDRRACHARRLSVPEN